MSHESRLPDKGSFTFFVIGARPVVSPDRAAIDENPREQVTTQLIETVCAGLASTRTYIAFGDEALPEAVAIATSPDAEA